MFPTTMYQYPIQEMYLLSWLEAANIYKSYFTKYSLLYIKVNNYPISNEKYTIWQLNSTLNKFPGLDDQKTNANLACFPVFRTQKFQSNFMVIRTRKHVKLAKRFAIDDTRKQTNLFFFFNYFLIAHSICIYVNVFPTMFQ